MEKFLTKNGIIVLTKPSKWSDNSRHQGYSIPFLIRNALQEISTVCFFFNSWRENTLIWNSIFQLRGKWAGWWKVTTSWNEATLHDHYITAAKESFVTNKLIGLHKLQMPRSLNLKLLRNRNFRAAWLLNTNYWPILK